MDGRPPSFQEFGFAVTGTRSCVVSVRVIAVHT
jgi:hypothetical protein